MSARICRKCGDGIPNRVRIDGKIRNIQNRQFCLNCSPWGGHNTKKSLMPSQNPGLQVCPKCKIEKSVSDFGKKGNRLQYYCRSCSYEMQKNRWIDRKKDAVILLGGKCIKCGYNKNFSVLHFHHRNGSIKEFDWNRLRLMSQKTVQKELDKCELMCANCHTELHNPQCIM